jgi:DNA-binding NarL/FixJ family response regulator
MAMVMLPSRQAVDSSASSDRRRHFTNGMWTESESSRSERETIRLSRPTVPQGTRDSSSLPSLSRALARLHTLDSVEALRRHGVVEAYRSGEFASATLWMLDPASLGGGWQVLCDAGIEGSFRRRRLRQNRGVMASVVLDDAEALADLRVGHVLVLHEPAGEDGPAGRDDRWPASAFALVDVDRDVVSVLQVGLSAPISSADIDVLSAAITLFAGEWGHMIRSARTIAQLRGRWHRAVAVIDAMGDPSNPEPGDVLELITLLTNTGESAIERRDTAPELGALTRREREVFALILEGSSNATISQTLFISPDTVKSHVRAILSKLHLASRLEVVAHYRDFQPGAR